MAPIFVIGNRRMTRMFTLTLISYCANFVDVGTDFRPCAG